MERVVIFALQGTHIFGDKVAQSMGMPLAEHEEIDFGDGEFKVRPLSNVPGRDVFVVQSLYSDRAQSLHEKLCRPLFFVGALKDASVA